MGLVEPSDAESESALPGQQRLEEAVRLSPDKILATAGRNRIDGIRADEPVLVMLAAGRGTRFGRSPKCIQPVCGQALARHSVEAFCRVSPGPVVTLVHYQQEEVVEALGDDLIYVHSDNPTGGTAFAAFETLSLDQLEQVNALLVISMGDRIVPSTTFQRLLETHLAGPNEADLTLLSAIYEPSKVKGKGRILRNDDGRVIQILEQRDLDAMSDRSDRARADAVNEANCPLYAVRAATLRSFTRDLRNDNAQGQYYFTDIVESIVARNGDIRSVTTRAGEPEYDLLCSDVTRPRDLALLEGVLASSDGPEGTKASDVATAADLLTRDRPAGQVASIVAQLERLLETAGTEGPDLKPDRPIGIGISGGRLRIAFMHPDMGRFFGPAWQMPIGAARAEGRDQIVILTQDAEDGKIHLFPTNPQFRERLNAVPADEASMYPGEEVDDWYSFEGFGTHMAENLLLSLGYFSDAELEQRRAQGAPLPPPSLWLCNSLRRPFSLIGNAIASMRTLREGTLGARVQTYLGREGFQGLKVMSTGSIPRGGFSSSSAVTVALKNAINALFNLNIGPDLLVHLACQAEYGTGVRAGSLDQATAQKGRAGQGAVISSNPRENYRVIKVFPVPTDRFKVLFPYSIDRDREAWQWSGGVYAAAPNQPEPTTAEMRKLTGKAAEMAAVLTRLPLGTDFFPPLEEELVAKGELSDESLRRVYDILQQIPLLSTRGDLHEILVSNRQWHIEQLMEIEHLKADDAANQTDALLGTLVSGWRDPLLRRGQADGSVVEETGVPLRSMVAYLFGEVAKNFYLIHHQEDWIEMVTRSQGGDRCLDIDPECLPTAAEMRQIFSWEEGLEGHLRLDAWLKQVGATSVDFNRGLDDTSLSVTPPVPLRLMEGGNFFRGLALIDLVEAMLKRAFGPTNVALRVNAAGQGDFFQVHVDTEQVDSEEVKDFLRVAYYRRFDLSPPEEFIELHPGGGAVGLRLSRFDALPSLIKVLKDNLVSGWSFRR